MALHVHLHDDEEEIELPIAAKSRATGPDGRQLQQAAQEPRSQPQQPQRSPFHEISAKYHDDLAAYHEGCCNEPGSTPDEVEAHQRAGHAHVLASEAHQREMPEALKFGEIAHKHSATAEDMSAARRKAFAFRR